MVALATCSLGWLDPHQRVREANRLYTDGKYEEAAAKYNEALVDAPDSPLLHFNLGDAAYKQGKYTDALSAFQKVPAGDDDLARTARVGYNIGNTKYRLGEAAEGSDPQAALTLYAEALAAYRRALGADADDTDAKLNHEFVERKIAELKKRLEEQQEQEQREQEQQEPQGEQAPEEDQAGENGQPQEDSSPPPDQQQTQGERQDAGAGEEPQEPPADESPSEMSQREAAALLDSQRDEEVQPEEISRRLHGAVLAEPARDW